MRTLKQYVWVCLWVFVSIAYGNEEMRPGRVLGNRVNIRSRPDERAEVLGQVNRGDVVDVRSRTDVWVEVAAPEGMEFWVHRDFVENGVVAPPRLNVRSGPGINYSVVYALERDERVTPLGEFSEWISITAPDGVTVWIASEFIEWMEPEVAPAPPPPPAPIKAAVAKPAPTPPIVPSPPAPPVVARPAPPPPEGLELIPLRGQGEETTVEGTIRSVGWLVGRPARYRLTRSRGHVLETVCYIQGNEAQLQSLQGHRAQIRGRAYWVQGARYPVLVPDQITLLTPED